MRAQAEGNDRAGVTEHRIYNRRFYLRQVLMARHNADGVFPQLRGHGGEAPRREALELVEINEERTPLGRFHLGTTERGKRYSRDEESAQERGGILANLTSGQVHNEDLSLIHDPANLERLFWAGKNAP